MTLKSKHYIRINLSESEKFESHIEDIEKEYTRLSIDIGTGTVLYSIELDSEEALALRLSLPMVGFLNFKQSLGNTKEKL